MGGGQFVVIGKVETGKELTLTVSGNKNEGKYLNNLSTCNLLKPVPKPKPIETCRMQRMCKRSRPPQCFSQRICRPSCYKYRPMHRRCCRAKHCRCPRRPYWSNRCPPTPTTPRPTSSCLRVKQIPPRSEAQEFMQRLHAFLNIKQLMKKEKESEAKEIALRSKFVTPLTSLVVVKPCEGELTSDLEESFEEGGKGRVGRSSQSYGSGSYGSGSYGKRSTGGRGRGRRGTSSRKVKLSAKKSKKTKRSRRLSSKTKRSLRGRMARENKISRKRSYIGRKAVKSKFQSQGSGSGYADDAGYEDDDDEYEEDTEYEDSGSGSLQSNEIEEGSCSLQLYSQTYHRGAEMNTTDSNPDLGSFADKAVSARMEGECCWTLFQDRNYRGSKIVLYPGRDYKSATSLGSLLTEASSVKKTTCKKTKKP